MGSKNNVLRWVLVAGLASSFVCAGCDMFKDEASSTKKSKKKKKRDRDKEDDDEWKAEEETWSQPDEGDAEHDEEAVYEPAPEPEPVAAAAVAREPDPVAPAAPPAPPPSLMCTTFRVQSARDARGAPFWFSLFDLMNNGGAVGAPMHVFAGDAVQASCRSGPSGQGYGVCARDEQGNAGWLHHDRLLSDFDPSGSLRSVLSLPVCQNDVCNADQCGP